MPRVWIRKTSPLFWHLSFYFSEGIFDSHLRRLIFSFVYSRRYLISLSRVGILWYLFGTYCVLVPKVFWFRPFERSKPLGVCFRTCCAFWCRRFFGSDLLKGRSPLAFVLALVVSFDAEGFLVRTFWRVEAPWRLFYHLFCLFVLKVFLVWTFRKVEAPWRLF